MVKKFFTEDSLKILINTIKSLLDGKASSSHNHSISNVTNLQTTLDNKAAKADLNSHTSDTTVHITNAERANWNAAESNSIAAANSYTDDKIANLLENSTEAVDSIFELRDAMEENADAISALETIAAGHADKKHTHKVEDITDITVDAAEINYLDGVTSNVQTQLDGKSNSGHTHDDKMDKNNPTGTGSFSLNRKAYSDIGNYSFAEGYNTISSGEASHAEGTQTIASGSDSHAEGFTTEASSIASHSEGYKTIASGYASHAEGGQMNEDHSDTLPNRTLYATSYPIIGDTDIVISSSTAQGVQSHAEGTQTLAFGYSSHAEGESTNALGKYSHAEGYNSIAKGIGSHAEGQNSLASGDYSHAEGGGAGGGSGRTIAFGNYSHAEGHSTISSGEASHAEGDWTYASGLASHAEGGTFGSDGKYLSTGSTIKASEYPIIGDADITIYRTTAQGIQSHAEGTLTFAFGYSSHAEGYKSIALGDYSHAEGGFHGGPGSAPVASGNYSHAEGCATKASGYISHAEGSVTEASGEYSHAEGQSTTASGIASHAEGYDTTASGQYSHSEGKSTTASGKFQHVQGKYNIEDTTNTYAHIVGNGTSDKAPSNAHTLDWSGNAWFAGGVTATSFNGFTIGKSVPSNAVFTDTKYSAGTGISLSGTTFSNSGVRSIGTGTANGTISVNTNGKAANVAVKGLGSAAYTASTAYATSGHNHDSTYSKTTHNHDGRYLRQYGLNEININSTSGTWTVDISDASHGSVPTPWVNVTQFSSGHFWVQMAIKCDNDSNGNRAQGAVWFRNKYNGAAWSQWRQV